MRRRRFEAAFIVTVGMGVAAAGSVAGQARNPPPQTRVAPRPLPALPPLHRGHVLTRNAAGECRLEDRNACDGAEAAGTCTLPSPTLVICPQELSVPGRIEVLTDGVCEVRYTPNCRPDATCNPPRPRRIPCPGS
jgi:hypothetical protein